MVGEHVINKNILTYAECKKIFETAKDPAKGKPLGGKGQIRIFKNKNNSFTLYWWPSKPKWGYSAKEPLFTIMPDGRYVIGRVGETIYGFSSRFYGYSGWCNAVKRCLEFLPVFTYGDCYDPRVIPQKTVRKPTLKATKNIERPFWVAKDNYRRAEYEMNIKQFGSLDEWHEAYAANQKIIDDNNFALNNWRNRATIILFEGAVITADGRVSDNSHKKFKSAKEAANKKRLIEVEKKRKEWEKARELAEKRRLKELRERRKAVSEKLKKKGFTTAEINKMSDMKLNFFAKNPVELSDDGKHVYLYKAVRSGTLVSYHGAKYPIGETVTDNAWRPGREGVCGNGLHFSPTPAQAHRWSRLGSQVTFLLCEIPLDNFTVIDATKVKAKSCKVLYEVSVFGERITADDKHPNHVQWASLKNTARAKKKSIKLVMLSAGWTRPDNSLSGQERQHWVRIKK